MFNDKEKDEILNELDKVINKTYSRTINFDEKKVNNQYINMEALVEYYDKKYKNNDFQHSVSKNVKELTYEKLMRQLNHEKEDEKQKDEGNDIVNEEIQKTLHQEISKSMMPAKNIDKEGILKDLGEMTEDEKNITEGDIKNFVKAATIKAIYEATLEKYEHNREEIRKHADIVRRRDGEFALEDRLALENRQYEVYLQKLAKQYKDIVPNHKMIQEDKKITSKEKEIRDEHNKEEEIKEKRRQDEIKRITLLYNQKEGIIEDMAYMSANPTTFDKAKFEDLQNKLFDVDRQLAMQKPSPALLIENANRDARQEELERKQVGGDNTASKVAITDRKNESKVKQNDEKIIDGTNDSQENIKNNAEDVVEKYWECREKGDIQGAKKQYKILKSMSGSKENVEEKVNDVTKDEKEDYKSDEKEENDIRKKDLNLDKVNKENDVSELEVMDADVSQMSRNLNIDKEDVNKAKGESLEDDNIKQHTLSNKRPY